MDDLECSMWCPIGDDYAEVSESHGDMWQSHSYMFDSKLGLRGKIPNSEKYYFNCFFLSN